LNKTETATNTIANSGMLMSSVVILNVVFCNVMLGVVTPIS